MEVHNVGTIGDKTPDSAIPTVRRDPAALRGPQNMKGNRELGAVTAKDADVDDVGPGPVEQAAGRGVALGNQSGRPR
jgi:hypothetical protein